MRLAIDELLILILAPRLQTYLTTPRPVWRDIVDAADWLRGNGAGMRRCGGCPGLSKVGGLTTGWSAIFTGELSSCRRG